MLYQEKYAKNLNGWNGINGNVICKNIWLIKVNSEVLCKTIFALGYHRNFSETSDDLLFKYEQEINKSLCNSLSHFYDYVNYYGYVLRTILHSFNQKNSHQNDLLTKVFLFPYEVNQMKRIIIRNLTVSFSAAHQTLSDTLHPQVCFISNELV